MNGNIAIINNDLDDIERFFNQLIKFLYIELTVKPENKELYNTNYENLAQISYQEIINQDTNIRKYLEELEIEDLENISINLARVQIIQPSGTDYIKYFEENIENINKKKLYLNDFSKKIYYFALSFIEILNKNIYDDSKVNDEELMKQFITILIATRGKDVMVQNKQLAESNKFLREYLQKIIMNLIYLMILIVYQNIS